jgi:hypothetical protein
VPGPTVEPEPIAKPKPATPPAPDKPSLRISITAVGDMMIGTDYPENHLPDDDGVSFLADVAPHLQSADIAFGNLEGVLMGVRRRQPSQQPCAGLWRGRQGLERPSNARRRHRGIGPRRQLFRDQPW